MKKRNIYRHAAKVKRQGVDIIFMLYEKVCGLAQFQNENGPAYAQARFPSLRRRLCPVPYAEEDRKQGRRSKPYKMACAEQTEAGGSGKVADISEEIFKNSRSPQMVHKRVIMMISLARGCGKRIRGVLPHHFLPVAWMPPFLKIILFSFNNLPRAVLKESLLILKVSFIDPGELLSFISMKPPFDII
jgi:hypothetical protein